MTQISGQHGSIASHSQGRIRLATLQPSFLISRSGRRYISSRVALAPACDWCNFDIGGLSVSGRIWYWSGGDAPGSHAYFQIPRILSVINFLTQLAPQCPRGPSPLGDLLSAGDELHYGVL
jgi:hypothetical protein